MFRRKIFIFSSIIILIINISCRNDYEKQTKNNLSGSKFVEYVKKISGNENITNNIFLILKTSECDPCIKELLWWNKNYENNRDRTYSTKLIFLEKHEEISELFIKKYDIQIPYYVDNYFLFHEMKLSSVTPIKVLFNSKEEIEAVSKMGRDGDLDGFLSKIDFKNE